MQGWRSVGLSDTSDAGFPARLLPYLDLIQDEDDTVSDEAALGLRFLIEKHCVTGGDADWLANVNAFLVPLPAVEERGVAPLVALDLTPEEIGALAHEIFRRLTNGAQPAWRHAYALRHAVNDFTPQAEIAAYLRTRWRDDEAVALLLADAVWATTDDKALLDTYDDMAAQATSEALRDYARQHAAILRELAGET